MKHGKNWGFKIVQDEQTVTYSVTSILQSDTDVNCYTGYAEDAAVLDLPSVISGDKYKVNAAGKMRYTNNPDNFWGNLTREGFTGLFGIYDTNANTDGSVKSQTLQARYNLKMKEACEFAVSIYAYSDFQRQSTQPVIISILDAEDNLLVSQAAPEDVFASGAYMSFRVYSDEINIIVECADSSNNRGIAGIFIDAVPDSSKLNLAAATGTANGTIGLTWDNTGLSENAKIAIERKLDGAWETVATVAASLKAYTDTGLTPEATYTYRAKVTSGAVASAYTAEVSAAAFKAEETACTDGDAIYYIGRDMATRGGWEGVYGKDIAFLYGYAFDATEYIDTTERFSVGHNKNDLIITAEGLTYTFTHNYNSGGNLRCWMPGVNVSADAILNMPASLEHPEFEVVAASSNANNSPEYNFTFSDDSVHVLPGNLISLNGYGMADVENLKVYCAPHGTAITAESATLPLVNCDAVYGYYVIVQLPVNATPGLYDVAVANSYGMSKVMTLNIARPLFIDEYEAWNGQTIMLSGRNLEGAQFGYDGTTKVRLVNGSEAVEQTITKLTPYSIRFTVSGTVGTTYYVEVSNNSGATWVRLDSEQTLTLVEEGLDPLGLGVAWAGHFNWGANYLNVKDFGAVAGDNIDDTAAFQAALDAAGAQTGGGVVYVPNGTYLVGNIRLPALTVLMGQSTEGTVLKYYNPNENNGGGHMFSNTADSMAIGQIGLANFSVRMHDDAVRPDTFIWLGHPWGTANKLRDARTAKEFFVSGVDIAYSYAPAQQRGLGMVYLAKERVVIQNSSFVGYYCNTQSCYVNEYCRYIGNYYSFDRGAVGSVALYNFVLDCTVNDVNRDPGEDNHAFMMRQTTHWENNWVEGTGNMTNVGEAFCVEMPGGYFAIGQVINATANTVTALFPNQTLEELSVMYGRLAVTITSGKGMGQVRDIESYDFSTGVIVLKEDWAVLPDATSRFTITCPLDRVTVYNNGMDDNTKGIFMYGNGYDNVVANNYLEDSEGIFVYSSDVLPGRSTPNYFTTIRDNVLNGPGTENTYVNISVRSNRPSGGGGTYFNTSIYAIEVRNNILIGDGTEAPDSNCSEANIANGLSSNSAVNNGNVGTDGVFGDNLGIIWENNNLQHLSTGIEVSLADYGFAYMGNILMNVAKLIVNEPKEGQNVTGLTAEDLIAAPAVSESLLRQYVALYKDPTAIRGYSEEAQLLLNKVIKLVEDVLGEGDTDPVFVGLLMNRLRIAASLRDIPQGGDEIIAILLNPIACLECKDENGDGICDACGHVFAVAMIGGERYGTVEAAMAAAEKGDTVKLVADAEMKTLALTKGITLDLNGYDLSSDYLVALRGNAVIDGAGSGVLTSKNVRLDAQNPHLPVWDQDAGGYRFFEMLDQRKMASQDANGFVFYAKPALGTEANNGLMAKINSNKLNFKIRMRWNNAGSEVEQLFGVKEETVASTYSQSGQVIMLTVSGAGSYAGKLLVDVYLESETGVIWTSKDLTYKGQ